MIEDMEFPAGLVGNRLFSLGRGLAPPTSLYHAASDFGVQSDFSAGQVSHSKSETWSFAKAELRDIDCLQGLEVVLTVNSPMLILALEEVGGRVTFNEGSRRQAARPSPVRGALNFLPTDAVVSVQGRSTKFVRLLQIEFDQVEFERVTGDPSPLKDLRSAQLMISDERIEGICRLIADECRQPGTSTLAYADSLVFALMIKLSRWRDSSGGDQARGGLAPWQVRKSQAYMLEHVSEPVSLQVLAELTGVSSAHFSRAFKTSIGASPYHWLIAARIDRAKGHLLDGVLSIADISLSLGFCDQAHLTRTFTKMVGVTPLVWRRSHMS